MKHKTLINLLLLALVGVLLSCNLKSDSLLDKQLRIYFPSFHWAENQSGWQYSESIWNINNFNIGNYSKADSIVLHAFIGNSSGDTCFLMLYNVTDGTDIKGSYITSTALDPELKVSLDFLDDLPQKDIELGLKMKFKSTAYAECTNPVLIIYR